VVHAGDDAAARHDRERHFHDQRFESHGRSRTARFYERAAGRERYRALVDAAARGHDVVEFGCGPGSAALRLGSVARSVLAIDLSPVAIELARARGERVGLPPSVVFAQMNAEALDVPDASVDLVCGSGVLHHLDLEHAYAEAARVLRPTGRAVFHEPLAHNPLLEWYRNRTPEERTVDEHPLRVDDLERARRHFALVDVEFYDLTAMGAFFLPDRWRDRMLPSLRGLDQLLFRRVPFARRYAWVVVMQLSEPRAAR
jgi:SAM-dependent methyltransferase